MTPLEAALNYIALGWNPVPVALRAKKPIGAGWQHRKLSCEDATTIFNSESMNVGLQLGANSNGLTDIDLDSPEAVAAAGYLLPETPCVFGRASKRASHWLYLTDLCERFDKAALQFQDPEPGASSAMLLEVRIGGGDKGAQTVAPSSVHESGEPIEFEAGRDGVPVTIDAGELLVYVKQLAAIALAVRHWPGHGARHDARLAIAGLLARGGIEKDRAKDLIEVIATIAGDLDTDDARSALASTYAVRAKGGAVSGIALAREVFGRPVADRLCEWLGVAVREDAAMGQCGQEDALQRLAALPKFEYERARQEEAKRLGIRVGKLDVEIEKRRAPDLPDGRGRPLALEIPEVWPEPVDGIILLGEFSACISRHVRLSESAAIAVTLWCVHAHAFEASSISPRLAITSPEKRCGKTTLLNVIGNLVPKPLSAANITSAALFRTVEAVCPTLLIDEADTFLGENEELRGIINAGHARNGQVVRLVGEDHEPRAFATCCPTAIAAIGEIPGTIEDRSISVSLRRRRNDELVERLRLDRTDHLKELSRKAARWAVDNLEALRASDPGLPELLHDRARDNWRPLLAIADIVGDEWPERARRSSLELSATDAEGSDTLSTQLLADIRAIFRSKAVDRLFTDELISSLGLLSDRPWPCVDRGSRISPTTMARLLKPFGIRPGTIRDGETTQKGYKLTAFEDAFARYLPCEPDTTSQA